MTSSEWFDAFEPAGAPDTTPAEQQWCARHWSPVPAGGYDGAGAQIEMVQTFADQMWPDAVITTEALTGYLVSSGPWCCLLGDDTMFTIWSHWPPP
jgi:hypothetical protein